MWWWRRRHLVAALALGLATIVALDEVRPAPPPTTGVVVLARARDAGAVLGPGDLVLRAVPAGLAPDGALRDVSDAEGRRLAVALPAGYPMAEGVLVGPGLAAGAPAGTVVVPVRLADAGVARLLAAGDRVDLMQAAEEGGGPADVLARAALVLATAEEEAGGILDVGGSAAPLLLVAVTPGAARLVTGASEWAPLSAVLVAP